MKRNFYVYLTTNLVNGKQYVGDHTINVHESNYYIGSGVLLKKAIKKYGEEKFFKEILEHFPSKKLAFESQEKYIKMFDTLSPNGYNLSPKGGTHITGGKHSEETIKLMKERAKGRNKGAKHSKETINKRLKSHKLFYDHKIKEYEKNPVRCEKCKKAFPYRSSSRIKTICHECLIKNKREKITTLRTQMRKQHFINKIIEKNRIIEEKNKYRKEKGLKLISLINI